jgi:hypothetical protein
MADKKRKGRRDYLNDFHKTASGEYVYEGNYYYCTADAGARKRLMVKLCVLSAVSLIAMIASGCFMAPGMDNCVYVILPYGLALVMTVSVVWGVCRLVSGGDPLKEYIYLATVDKLPLRGGVAAALSVLALVGETIYLICKGAGDRLAYAIVYLVLQIVSALANFLVVKLISSNTWEKR